MRPPPAIHSTWVKSCPSQQFKFCGTATIWTVHGCSQAAGAALRRWCRRDCPKMATISSLFLQGKLLRIQRWQPTNLDPGARRKHLEWGMEPSTSTHLTADRPPTSVTWHVYLLSDPCWGEGTSPLLQTCHTVAKEIRIQKKIEIRTHHHSLLLRGGPSWAVLREL